MMAADVEEAAQHAVGAAHRDHRLAGSGFAGDELSGMPNLGGAADDLPAREDGSPLELEQTRIEVPRRRNGEGPRQRRVSVVAANELLERNQFPSPSVSQLLGF
jgi:hypothetical protein